MLSGLIVTTLVAIVSFATTSLIRRDAHRLGLVQAPNGRSSHTVPTPSGGGIGIVVGGTIAASCAAVSSTWPTSLLIVLALLMAGLGFQDDRRPIPARYRFTMQVVLASLALCFAIPLEALTARIGLPLPALLIGLLAIVGTVYWINLFNFMDGVDGMAGSQAVFMLAAATALAALHTPDIAEQGLFWTLIGVGAATAGFLVLNWPPAKIFMGDAGSTYLGFIIAVLALLTIVADWVTLLQWAILAACFVADATVTLLRRLLLGERVFEAHRRHAYQKLSRGWGSHRAVTLTFIGINLVWLLPLAFLASLPGWGFPATLAAYLPLIVLVVFAGAGAPETQGS